LDESAVRTTARMRRSLAARRVHSRHVHCWLTMTDVERHICILDLFTRYEPSWPSLQNHRRMGMRGAEHGSLAHPGCVCWTCVSQLCSPAQRAV
jgi:hypothetical protein